MSREVRRVRADWVHPKVYGTDRFTPLHEHFFFEDALHEWNKDPEEYGPMPTFYDYMPNWTEEEATHYMMYESTSEGTPKSPAFETPEMLAQWLVDNKVSAFGCDCFASYEAWLRIARGGWAPSAMIQDGVAQSGVEALKDA